MPSSSHPATAFAAAASAAAGMLHAAAAGSHADLTTLSRLFGLAAVLQIGWAGAALLRPGRALALAGIGINLGILSVWVVTRANGISAIEGLEAAQTVGLQDGLAAGLAVLAAVSAALSLSSDPVPRPVRAAVPVLVAVVALAAIPAMAEPHDHSDHAHDTGATGEVASAGAAADDHPHDDDHVHDDDHDHGEDHGEDHDDDHVHDGDHGEVRETPSDADLGYPASFAAFLDEAETPEQRERAEELMVTTNEAMAAFPDEAAVQAAGYVSIGDGATGWEHYIHIGHIADPAVLDPEAIESIVLRVDPDGTKEVASAMYLMPFGTTMDDVPDIAGDLTQWHDHQNLCWEGARVVGTTDATGACARGEFRATQPMLHVWVTEHPCGPFAGIEGSHGSGCDHHAHED